MAIDTSMYGTLRPVQLPNPLEQYANTLQVQNAQRQGQMGEMELAAKRRDVSNVNEMNALYQQYGTKDREGMLAAAAQRGLGSQIPGLQKSFAEADKAAADIGKTKADTAKSQVESARQVYGMIGSAAKAVMQNPTYQNALTVLASLRQSLPSEYAQTLQGFEKEIPQDPTAIAQWANQHYLQAQDADKMAVNDLTRASQVEAARHNKAQETNAAGQLSVAQQRLRLDQAAPRGQVVETENGIMLVDPRAGTGQAVTGPDGQPLKGKAATRALTEGQGKSTAFAMRAIEAENQVNTLGDNYNPSLKDRAAIGAPFDIARGVASEGAQRHDTAKRNFIASVLRKESGAAVSPAEFDMYNKMYFPQVGESDGVKADKKKQRALAIEGMMAEAGPGAEVVNKNVKRTPAAGGVPDDIADLLNKHGGKQNGKP